jgi:hypothetical protein
VRGGRRKRQEKTEGGGGEKGRERQTERHSDRKREGQTTGRQTQRARERERAKETETERMHNKMWGSEGSLLDHMLSSNAVRQVLPACGSTVGITLCAQVTSHLSGRKGGCHQSVATC